MKEDIQIMRAFWQMGFRQENSFFRSNLRWPDGSWLNLGKSFYDVVSDEGSGSGNQRSRKMRSSQSYCVNLLRRP